MDDSSCTSLQTDSQSLWPVPRKPQAVSRLWNSRWLLTVGLLFLTLGTKQVRADATVTLDTVTLDTVTLDIQPNRIQLVGPRAHQHLLVTSHPLAPENLADVRDVSSTVVWTSSNPDVVQINAGVAQAVHDGTATLTAKLGDVTVTAEVTVSATGTPQPTSLKNETLAALTKAGCNMGACHGSPTGKGGFRLSLRGYDPTLDMLTLKTENQGRRTNLIRPDDSLVLKKPLMELAHAGGKRLHKGDLNWTAIRNWIAEGMALDAPTVPDLQRIEVFPKLRVFQQGGDHQHLIVNGYYSDGSVRDLTNLTVFSSSAEAIATVNEQGLVKKQARGETAVLARFLDKMDTSYITFLEEVPGFAWKETPEVNFIDQLVNEKLKQLQILPSDLCSDEEFVRRVYLDTAGRLPSVTETNLFLNDQTPDHRTKLIDQLLDSPEFASFWSLKLADILRVSTTKLTGGGMYKFDRWIFESVLNDLPMDEFARDLLTARGSAFENPAAAYWRASREPMDATETTAQLFLGIRIQCAKCHNHPFERWTQDNYYGIGAAFARVGRKPGSTLEDEVIFPAKVGESVQPRTGKTMKVHLLLTGDVDVPLKEDRRKVFADWLTKPENPFFAKATVNRIWGHLMGRGIVEPVDDFRDSNPPSNAKLLEELARQFTQSHYSRKWVMRTIMNSHTYQLSSRTNRFNKEDEIYCSHSTTRMLSAEQLLDSICAVTGVDETFAGTPAGTRASELPEPPTDNYFLKVFGQPQREMACECERSNESNLSQALQMINGPTVHNKLRDDKGRIAQMITAEKTDAEIVTYIYRAALCREPTTQELDAAKHHMGTAENRRAALEDIGWAVLNSKEFLFQH